MRVVLGDRLSGKTYRGVEWVKEVPDRYFVVMHEAERRRVCDLYNLPREKVMTWGYLDKIWGSHGKVFWDNADLYLGQVAHRLGLELGGWSASIGDNAVILGGSGQKDNEEDDGERSPEEKIDLFERWLKTNG